MIRTINYGIASLAIIFLLCSGSVAAEKSADRSIPDSEVTLHIKQQIFSSKKSVQGEEIYSSFLVASFYKGRGYGPAWSHEGRLMQVEMLMRAIEESYGEGLSPAYYHLIRIRSMVDGISRMPLRNPAALSDLDILLSDAFITLGCHLSAGCVNPLMATSEWFAKGGRVDVASLLEKALKMKMIRESLMDLRPNKDIYTRLRHALTEYRELRSKGEWPLLSSGPPLKKGSMSGRVLELRKRLAASGDLIAAATDSDIFDDGLEQAVITFQKRHGLEADGVVGRVTRRELNVPLQQRIRQIELNMERLRWIFSNLEDRFIVVNIADYRLFVFEKENMVLSMKVVVGKPYLSTPIFAARMTYIVINPSWNIPKSIVQKELPANIAKDPDYLAEQDIEVLRDAGKGEIVVNPKAIDWSHVSQYRFRQRPGLLNALGRLKFVFPNSYDVYLHDTPAKNLFSQNVRTFSHGCIRIEKPLELAEYLLRDDPVWTSDALNAALDKGDERIVSIPRPLNVHLLYLTAWVGRDGVLQFRDDIYGRDKVLDEALRKKPYIP